METQLGNALGAMQEGSMLMRQVADHAGRAHEGEGDARLTQRADALERQADAVRTLVTGEEVGAERKA